MTTLAKLNNGAYCDAKDDSGKAITGWIVYNKSGTPAYFRIEDGGGYCAPIESLTDIKPVTR